MDKFKRRVLVTGGLGFIGSNFLNYWTSKCPDTLFVNMDNGSHGSSPFNVYIQHLQNYKLHHGDVSNLGDVNEVFATHDITDVIHFAAETHVDRSIEHSSLFVKTNVVGTENLLKAFVTWNCHKEGGVFLYVSTDEVYGETQQFWKGWQEHCPLEPRNIYSATKAAGEHLVNAYGNVHGFKPRITRAGNNYGPNQDESKLIPKMIMKALLGEQIEIYGDGTNFRQWTHVQDHVIGLGKVLFARETQGVWNIAGDDILTNNQVISHILAATNSRSKIVYVKDRPAHDKGYLIDCSKIKQHLLWNPSIAFSQGIASLIDRYVPS